MRVPSRLRSWRWWFGLSPPHLAVPFRGGDVTVVIPALNEEGSIGRTVLSIKRQTAPPCEILVVDDHSTDRTAFVAQRFGATVLRLPKNSGTKAQALNCALPHIQTEFVCIVDADTILKRDALENILPAFHDERVAAACGFVIPQKIETFWERARFIEYLFGLSLYKRAQNHVGTVFVCSGCFSVFRRQSLVEAGGFNPRTIAEDMDYTRGLMESDRKWEVAFVSNALCFPIDPATFPVLVAQLDRWYRGFLQCLKVRKWRIRNWKLGMLAYWYLLDFVFGWIFVVAGLAWYMDNLVNAIAFALLVQFVFVGAVCLFKGAFLGKFWKTAVSLPCYFPLYGINSALLWRSIFLELVRNRTLTTWHKGH